MNNGGAPGAAGSTVRTRSALAVAVTAVAAVAAAGRITPAPAVAVTAIDALIVASVFVATCVIVAPASPKADAPSGRVSII